MTAPHHQIMIGEGLPPEFCRVPGDRPPAARAVAVGSLPPDPVAMVQAERRAVLQARAKAKGARRIEKMKARLAYQPSMTWNAQRCRWE